MVQEAPITIRLSFVDACHIEVTPSTRSILIPFVCVSNLCRDTNVVFDFLFIDLALFAGVPTLSSLHFVNDHNAVRQCAG